MAEKTGNSKLPFLLAGLALSFLVLWFSPFSGEDWPKVGEAAPNLNSFPVEGKMSDTTNRVIFLDFWASWCGPCELSFPLLNEFHRTYKDRGLVVIGVNLDPDPDDMKNFLRRRPVEYSIVRDAYSHLTRAFNASTLPRSFVIGADGKIAASHFGFDPQNSRQQFIEEIEAALKAAGK